MFTPIAANRQTLDYFVAQGVPRNTDDRLFLAEREGGLTRRWTRLVVTDLAGNHYRVEARSAPCGFRCHCDAEIRLPKGSKIPVPTG